MNFARAHKVSVYLVAWCAYLALVMSGELSDLVVAASILGIVTSWWWEAPRIKVERWTRVWSALGLAVFAGCGDDDDGPTGPGPNAPADSFPPASSPEFAVLRLLETYGARNSLAYDRTLTRDFRFHFSTYADPDLVMEFGDDWDIELENAAARHLFEGFTDGHGSYQSPATSIESLLSSIVLASDSTHVDSTQHYARVSIPTAVLFIDLEDGSGFQIASPLNVYVVRGDAAVLGADQAADPTVWYVRRIDDLAAPLSGVHRMKPARAATWGAIRVLYTDHDLGAIE